MPEKLDTNDDTRKRTRTIFSRGKRRRVGPGVEEKDGMDRDIAIDLWVRLCVKAGYQSGVFRTAGGDPEQVRKTLAYIFASRATSTILKRGRALWTFARWVVGLDLPDDTMPCDEAIVYKFLDDSMAEGCAATMPRAFLEAVSLMFAVLEIAGRELVLSARNNGIADVAFNRKRPTVQRPGLSVEDVGRLEDGVFNASRLVYRIFA